MSVEGCGDTLAPEWLCLKNDIIILGEFGGGGGSGEVIGSHANAKFWENSAPEKQQEIHEV